MAAPPLKMAYKISFSKISRPQYMYDFESFYDNVTEYHIAKNFRYYHTYVMLVQNRDSVISLMAPLTESFLNEPFWRYFCCVIFGTLKFWHNYNSVTKKDTKDMIITKVVGDMAFYSFVINTLRIALTDNENWNCERRLFKVLI